MQVAAVLMVLVLVLALAVLVECAWQRWWGPSYTGVSMVLFSIPLSTSVRW